MAMDGTSLYQLAQAKVAEQQTNDPLEALVKGFGGGMQQHQDEQTAIRQREQEFQQQQRNNLMVLAQAAAFNERQTKLGELVDQTNQDKSIYSKASTLVDNPSGYGLKIIKPKPAPPTAMMQLASGAFGDVMGNQLPDTEPEIISQPPPTVPKGGRTIPRQVAQMKVGGKGEMSYSIEDNPEFKDLQAIKMKVAEAGGDASQVTDVESGMSILAGMKSEENNVKFSEKESQFQQKRLQLMGDDLDPAKNVRNPYGVAQLNVSRAERIEGLVNQYKDLNLDSREMEELAIGLNSLLQGSNVSAQKQVEALVPKSAIGNVQRMKEWLVNEPQGLKQQAFVQRMLNDVLREKQVSQGQVLKFARSKLAKYNDVRKNNPEDWDNVVRSFGISPEVYDKWAGDGFKDELPTDVVGRQSSVQEFTPEEARAEMQRRGIK